MKKQFLILFFICTSSITIGQIHETGIVFGGTNYVGDIGRTDYLLPNSVGGGLIYKYNLNPRIAFRGTLSFLSIKGDDINATNAVRKNRGYTFKNAIKELAVGIEFNFFEYDLSSRDKTFTPYILLKIAGFMYDAPNAETAAGQYTYKNKTSFTVPFGIGFKTRLIDRFAIAIETKVNYTFEDDIDFSTKRISSLDFGGNGNDWYMFTGFSIVYTFGRPACYADLK